MRALIQRVTKAAVTVDEQVVGSINQGLLILLGICHTDTSKEALWLADKLATLRIFGDIEGKMNLSIKDLGLEALVVSQFTLYGDCMSSRRPDFAKAAPPELAKKLYQEFIIKLENVLGKKVATGAFGAKMQVELINDGPVTFMIENK